MSNRDPNYGRTTASGVDPFQASPHPDNTNDTKDKAKDAADTAMNKGQQAADTAKQKAGQASEKAHEAAGKAHEAAGQAEARADQGMHQAASGLDQAADTLREKGGQQGGSMGSAAAMTADKLDSASGYLRDKDTEQILNDVESLVRRKPTESLLVAAGVGFVLSKVFR